MGKHTLNMETHPISGFPRIAPCAESTGAVHSPPEADVKTSRVSMRSIPALCLAMLLQVAGCGGVGEEPPAPVPARVATLDPFDETVLHYVDLTVAAEHLSSLVPGEDARVPARLVFDDVTLEDVGLRLKEGLGSRQPLEGKPGFNLKTNEFVKGQKIHGVKKFTLNSAIQDPTFLSEHVAYDLWRRAGVEARRTALARVTFNGEYFGVYVVAESYDDGPVDRAFDSGGNLYEGVPGVDLTDPYGLDLDTNDEANDRSDLEALADVLESEPDATFSTALGQHLDVDAFLTYWAVESLVVHWDAYAGQNHGSFFEPDFLPNNWYAYRDPGSARFHFLPHGADQCFVRPAWHAPVDAAPSPRALLAVRCLADPGLLERFRARVREILDRAWDVTSILGRIRACVSLIEGSVVEGDRFQPRSVADFRRSIRELEQFIGERAQAVRGQLGPP